MYKYTDNTQSNFLDFNQPIGLHMNPENRWVKMADAIPWGALKRNIPPVQRQEWPGSQAITSCPWLVGHTNEISVF